MEHTAPTMTPGTALRRAAAIVRRRTLRTLGAVALLAAVTGTIMNAAAPSYEGDAHAVNIAGRQRMLSQRIAGAAVLAADGDLDASLRMVEAWQLFMTTHATLRSGHGRGDGLPEPTTEMRELYGSDGGLDDQVAAVDAAVRTVADRSSTPAAVDAAVDELVTAAADRLLEDLDRAVTLEERLAEAHIASAERRAWSLVVATVLTILGVGAAGFVPLLRGMRTAADQLDALDEKAAHRTRWQRDFAAIASHELRTPVTVVTGLAATLDSRWDDLPAATRRDFIGRMSRKGSELALVLDELALIAGLAGPAVRSTSWSTAMLRDAVAQSHGVPVDAVDLRVDLDVDRVTAVVRELVDNAVVHGAAPVRATVRHDEESAGLVIEVADAGTGIDPDRLPELISPFGRGTDARRHSSEQGHGLGLAIVAAVAADCGGRVEWEPCLLGGAWRVTLPNCVVGVPQPTVVTAPRTSPRPERQLLDA